MVSGNGQRRRGGLLDRVTCPHCWESFPPEKVLWISEHQDLLGDPRLGPEQPQRFLPTRFNVAGEAIDARGFPCQQLACPHCHLSVPRPFLEMEPLFLSIFGAPASGKSYLLAAMSWELRRILPLDFAVSFSDADPVSNRVLNEYQESLFSNPQAAELVPLTKLIRKTEEQGELYDMVSYKVVITLHAEHDDYFSDFARRLFLFVPLPSRGAMGPPRWGAMPRIPPRAPGRNQGRSGG